MKILREFDTINHNFKFNTYTSNKWIDYNYFFLSKLDYNYLNKLNSKIIYSRDKNSKRTEPHKHKEILMKILHQIIKFIMQRQLKFIYFSYRVILLSMF